MKREIARASMGNGECRDHDQPNYEITHKRPPPPQATDRSAKDLVRCAGRSSIG